MKNNRTLKLSLAGTMCAVAVVGSLISFPVFGSKCAPVQHVVNVLCAVLLGPGWAVGVAFTASLLRNMLGLGSLLAFPGSVFGALLCGLAYRRFRQILPTVVAEVFGTGIIGGLASYPIAIAFMGIAAGSVVFYAYVVPFLVSTTVGAILAGLLLLALERDGLLRQLRHSIHPGRVH